LFVLFLISGVVGAFILSRILFVEGTDVL